MGLFVLGLTARLCLSAADVSVALPAFTGTADVPQAKRDFFLEYFSQQLMQRGGLTVTTPAQIAAVLGVERQRQLLGCGDDGSCNAELAGALGADAIIIGSLAKIGDDTAVTLKAIDARSSKVITSVSGRDKKEEAVLDFLTLAATQIHDDLLLKLRGVAPAGSASSLGGRLRPIVIIPGAVGVAAAIASGVLFAFSQSAASRLNSGDPTLMTQANAHTLASTGGTEQVASAALLIGGAAVLVTALVLFFVLPAPPAKSVHVADLYGFHWAGLEAMQ
jgi:hypothetical protein